MRVVTPEQHADRQDAADHGRIHYLDNLRSFIVCIVVVFHAALAFMIFCPEWWPVADPQQNLFFTGVVLLTDVPIMPIMFLLAGYFGLESLRRRGLGDFWHDKFWRIVVPWLLGIVVIAPFCPYFLLLSRDANPPSFLHVLTDLYFTERYNTQGALWFLGVLTVFFGALSLVWAAWPALRRVDEHPGRPTAAFWVGFSAVVMVVFLAVNQFWFDFQWVPIDYVLWVQPTRVSLEAFYFVLGVHACRGRWFVAGGYRPNVVVWLPVAVAAGALLFVYKMWVGFLMPELWMRAGHAVLHCLFCLATTLALIGLFQAHADRTGAFLGRLAAASFGIYWVHMPIVFAFNLLVRGYDWNIYVKYLVVSALALVVSHLVASRGLLLLPIFGGRRLTSPRLLAR